MKRMRLLIILACAQLLLGATQAFAQNAAALQALESRLNQLQALVENQGQKIKQLEVENASLRKKDTQAAPSSSIQARVSAPASTGPVASFNPDIGVVADIVGTLSEDSSDEEGNDRLSARHVEFVFGHDVDPYTRLDSSFTFSDFEDPDIEEAYITHTGIPDFKLRFGRFRAPIGKASSVHREQLEAVDEPLVVQRYLGVEGYFKTGAEISTFLPLPWETTTHELALGIMEGGTGEDGQLFGSTRRRPTFYSRLRNFHEISDSSDIELSGTYLLGSSDDDSSSDVNAFGVDLTYTNYITPVNRLKLQAEAIFQDRDAGFLEEEEEAHGHLSRDEGDDAPIPFRSSPWGFYALADYRLSSEFGIGARYDYVESVNINADASQDYEQAVSTMFSFYQSEFSRWRLQYQWLESETGEDDNRFMIQGVFAIGQHKHQLR